MTCHPERSSRSERSRRIAAVTICVCAVLAFGLFAPQSVPAFAASPDGAAVYAANCATCHGASGQGTPDAVPPLAKDSYAVGDPKKCIHTVLAGMNDQIVVNGKTYNGGMPPWKGVLTNAQIAAVLTYVRSSWGNKASAITERQVAATK